MQVQASAPRVPLRLLLVLTLLASLVPALVWPSPAAADTTTITGTVFDWDTSERLPNISIRVQDFDTFDETTTTDVDGDWSMPGVPTGVYVEVMAFDPAGGTYGFGVESIVGAGGDYVEHYLSPGSMLSGKVTDSSLAAVAGVEVTSWTGPDPVITDANGDFAFEYPFPEGWRSLAYEPPAGSGLLGTDEEYELVGGTPMAVDVVLFAPGSMSGTVTEADGVTAIGEIDVTVTNTSPDCWWTCEYYTSTANDGTWSVTDLPPSDYIVHFEDWWHGLYASEYYNGIVRESQATLVSVTEGTENSEIDATLDLGTSISGTVVAHGHPVTDADLRLFEGGTAPENEVAWSGTCCGDNSFDFLGLLPGTYYLLVELEGVIQHWHGSTGQIDDAAPLAPASAAPIEGLVVELQEVAVVDASVVYEGQPLADLELDYEDDASTYFTWEVTDTTGSATLFVPPGPGTITSYGAFHATEPLAISPTAGEVLTPTLTATSTNLGTVGNPDGVTVDPSTDTAGVHTVEAGAAFTVTFDACAEAWEPWLYIDPIVGADWFDAALIETSPGSYEATLPEGVAPGLYEGSAWMDCVGGMEEVQFGLYSPNRLQVVDRSGTPLPGVDATLTDANGDVPLGTPSARLAPITPDALQITDADGMFGWLLDQSYDYGLVLSDGSCTATFDWLWGVELSENTFELDCGPLPQDAPGVWGVVQDATTGDPLSGIDVELWGWNSSFEYGLVAKVTTAADGLYAFGDEHVDTFENYELFAIDPTEQFGLGSGWVFIDEDPLVLREDLHMADEATIVSGTVTSKAGPVEGAMIDGLGPTLVTSASGAYRSVALPRNDFFFLDVAPPDGSNLYGEWVDLETTDPTMTVDVYLKSPGAITGAVTDGADTPLAGIIVSSASFGQVLTGADGTYEAPEVFPGEEVVVQFYDETGTYAYEWWNDQTSEAMANPITVVEGEATPNINAVLGPGASIVGTITAVGGEPIPGQWVALYDSAGNFLNDTQTDDTGHYAFPGLQVGSYVVGYVGLGGPWYPGDTDVKSSATSTEVPSTGTEVVQDLQVPGVGFVGGVVRQNGNPVVGVWVTADDGGMSWDGANSGDGGVYRVVALVGTVDVSASAGQWSTSQTFTGLSVSEGQVTMQDFDLTSEMPGGTEPPPDGTTVEGSRTSSSGLPTLGAFDPVKVTTTGCVGGTASFDIVEVYPGSGTTATDVVMTEGPDGTYVGTAPAQEPGRVYSVQISIDCPGSTPDESTDFGLYIDPAGTIVDTSGNPIEGATATLYRSDEAGGPYTVVPDGSTIMSPENRTNPDIVGADGVFQWLTIEGWYKVRAEKDGCTAPGSDATFVETDELPVPPEHVGLILILDCPAPVTSITSGPSGTVGMTTATFEFSSDIGGATFECRLDDGEWAACSSPKEYTSLSDGPHTFDVRARASGVTDATPANRAWTVDTAPPDTTVTGGTSGTVSSTSGSVTFTAETGSTFECQLDGGAWEACTSPKSYSGLSQGSHTVKVRAIDAVGNVDPTPAERSWTVDTVAPDTSITSGPADVSPSQTASFEFTATEGGSTFECRLDGGAWALCTSPVEHTSLADGEHTFDVRATDAVGNTDTSPASQGWVVDTGPPDTTITDGPPEDGTVKSTSASISFTATETGSTFECQLDAGEWEACTSPKSYSSLSQGAHTVLIRATDVAARVDPMPAERSWTVDTVAPDTSITSGPSGTTASQTASFGFTGTEEGSTFECRLDGGSWASCTSPKEYTSLSDGAHEFEVRASDAVGNTDASPDSRGWIVDTGPPDTTITGGPSGAVKSTSGSVTFTSTEAGSTFECKLDAGAWTACTSPKSYSGLSQGTHTVQVRATDVAASVDPTPATRSWTVDTVAPDTSITSGPSGTTASDSASFGFGGSELGVTFQCRLDGGSWATCTSPKAYSSLTDGSHTFQVRARDAVGNTDGSPASRSWTVDLPDAPDPTPDPVGPTPEFKDDDDSVFQKDIEKLAASGITKGCNPPANDKFCPDDEVTRGAMAAFLVRGMEYPAAPLGRFEDSRGHLFEADIVALAKAGVTKGCNPPTNDEFCPDDFVTRGEMAAFLTRALELPAAPLGRFDDSRGHLFEADIAALAAAGITKGCNPPANDKFCPDDFVERGEMAAFLVRGGLTD